MQKRCLGSTNIEVSVLGLGTVKLGRNQGVKYPQSFSIPSDKQVKELLDAAYESGINLLDTAPAYGNSEERVGKLLANREDWVIVSKVGEEFVNNISEFDFTRPAIIKSLDRSLKRLRTDYLDILLVHSDGNDEIVINEYDVFATLEECKAAGKIRAFGLSSKTVKGGMLTIDQADCAMVAMNPGYADEISVIRYAQQKRKGILIKKAFASGHLNWQHQGSAIESAFRYIFAEPGVTSVITGTINKDHLRENVEAVERILS